MAAVGCAPRGSCAVVVNRSAHVTAPHGGPGAAAARPQPQPQPRRSVNPLKYRAAIRVWQAMGLSAGRERYAFGAAGDGGGRTVPGPKQRGLAGSPAVSPFKEAPGRVQAAPPGGAERRLLRRRLGSRVDETVADHRISRQSRDQRPTQHGEAASTCRGMSTGDVLTRYPVVTGSHFERRAAEARRSRRRFAGTLPEGRACPAPWPT